MLKRLKQVYSALRAAISEKDYLFVAHHLSQAEAHLFWAMSRPDQNHALNVAYTVQELIKTRSDSDKIDKSLLLKAALLHDVGRVHGDMSTFDKSLAVALYTTCPVYAQKWAAWGRGNRLQNLRHALYIYYHHASMSAQKLRRIGAEEQLIQLVAAHHRQKQKNDPLELDLLRQADDLN